MLEIAFPSFYISKIFWGGMPPYPPSKTLIIMELQTFLWYLQYMYITDFIVLSLNKAAILNFSYSIFMY